MILGASFSEDFTWNVYYQLWLNTLRTEWLKRWLWFLKVTKQDFFFYCLASQFRLNGPKVSSAPLCRAAPGSRRKSRGRLQPRTGASGDQISCSPVRGRESAGTVRSIFFFHPNEWKPLFTRAFHTSWDSNIDFRCQPRPFPHVTRNRRASNLRLHTT